MSLPFFTIGHSDRSLEEFVRLLQAEAIELVADIRKVPMSRSNPQFNRDTLPDVLLSLGIAYEHFAALGGFRASARTLPPEVNGFWTNQSFHNYADYTASEQFHAALEHLLYEGRQRRVVIMCSEAVWWHCHRRIVADYLVASGEAVFHIMGIGRLEPARLTSGAIIRPGGVVTYPSIDQAQIR